MNKRIKKKTQRKALPKAQVVNEGKLKACDSIWGADDYAVFTINYSGGKYGMHCNTNLTAERLHDFIINAAPGFIPQKNAQLNTNPN